MDLFLYDLIPTISFGFVGLLFLFNIWRRSISTFISIMGFAIISNLMYYGYIDAGMLVIPIVSTLLIIRAMIKPANDLLLPKGYYGKERRGKRNAKHN